MTAKELIEKLSKLDLEMEVYFEDEEGGIIDITSFRVERVEVFEEENGAETSELGIVFY